MIAPIREVEPPPGRRSRRSGDVRRLVAAMFLDEVRNDQRAAPPIPRWKAWVLIGWAVAITAIYLARMLGLF